MYAREGVVTLGESPSTISSLVLLLVLISGLPTNEFREATFVRMPKKASESITIQLQCPRMH